MRSFFSTRVNSNQLGPYLAGLIEGDGSIIVPRPFIEIAFDMKDLPLMNKIISVLGGGYIALRSNSGILVIKKSETLLNLVLLINGHMWTPKIEALHRLITWLNIHRNTNIPLLGLDNIPIMNNSWLSGFWDADGYFYFYHKLNKHGMPIGLVYYGRITQKQVYTRKTDASVNVSNYAHMHLIATMLGTKVVERIRNKTNYIESAYEVRTGVISSKTLLFCYFAKFPLFGYKYFKLITLNSIHQLSLSKSYKTLEGKEEFFKLSALFHNPDHSDWSHLDNFYSG